MRVVIHADASPEIGTGHVIRCLALATALRADGAQVVLAADAIIEPLADRAMRAGVDPVARRDAPRHPDWVVVDGYGFDAPARDRLAEADVPRLVIDDAGGEVAGAMVLNQNLYASPLGPTHAGTGELLAGPSYALLHPEYADAAPERSQPERANRVLVTMGGSDPRDATTIVIEALAGRQLGAEIRVVIGAAHPDPAAADRAARSAGFTSVRSPSSLAAQLAWADLVVSGCGTTVLEAARLGRPIVGVVLADNQEPVARALEREGLGIVAGRHPSLDPTAVGGIVASLAADEAARAEISHRGPLLVDGRGARRVSRALATGPLGVRETTIDDADLILAWRNDPVTRAASFDTSAIDRSAHLRWLHERLESDADRVWLGVIGSAPVGVVRFNVEGRRAVASVTVAPEWRGRGIATRLISNGCARVGSELDVDAVDAWIRPDNVASIAAFRAAGFRPQSSGSDRVGLRLAAGSVR